MTQNSNEKRNKYDVRMNETNQPAQLITTHYDVADYWQVVLSSLPKANVSIGLSTNDYSQKDELQAILVAQLEAESSGLSFSIKDQALLSRIAQIV